MYGSFELSLLFQRRILARSFTDAKVRSWLKEARGIYKELRSELPEIGGRRNKMRPFLTSSLLLMPIALILKREGVPIRKVGEILYGIAALAFNSTPLFARKTQATRLFSEKESSSWMEISVKSKERKFEGDWVLEFIGGESSFHHGYDVTECAILKYWKSHELEEFVPYLCLTDWAKWNALGIEVRREGTLANGCAKCDFRFIRPGCMTPTGWPPETMPEWTGCFDRGSMEK